MKVRLYYLSVVLFFGALLFLTLNRHSKSGVFNYHAEIWADKAGYYVYLPATFIYNWQGTNLPDSIEQKTGFGFSVQQSGKIFTKYPVGVALMQLPFFVVTHYVTSLLTPEQADGFSIIYHRMIDVAAVVYALLGMIFLFKFLSRFFSKKVSVITVLSVFFATNVFYYAINETGMSHIFSFFLFAVYFYLGSKIDFSKSVSIKQALLLGLVVGLIFLLRSINVLVLPLILIFNNTISIKGIIKNISKLLLAILVILLTVSIQLIYWKYVSGHWIMDSYEGESFDFLHPQILKFWFSTHNGLFAYTPLWFLMLSGLYFLFKENKRQAIVLGTYFLVISYIFSSWWSWHFGCGYGMRPMVEFTVVYAIPLGYFVKFMLQKRFTTIIYVVTVVLLATLSINGQYHYDGCWYHGLWDYDKLWLMFTEELLW